MFGWKSRLKGCRILPLKQTQREIVQFRLDCCRIDKVVDVTHLNADCLKSERSSEAFLDVYWTKMFPRRTTILLKGTYFGLPSFLSSVYCYDGGPSYLTWQKFKMMRLGYRRLSQKLML